MCRRRTRSLGTPVPRSSEVGGKMINFICKFDIDEDATDLVLEAIDYEIDPVTAEYGAWLLLVSVIPTVESVQPAQASSEAS